MRQDPSTNEDSKMIKSLKELSQILAVVGISASQEAWILTAFKNIPASREVIKEEEFHEQQQEETKESWTTFDEDNTLEPDIREFLRCLSTNPLCIQETNNLKGGYLHGMVEEDIHNYLNEEVNQGHHYHIEKWFQTNITSKHLYLLQQLLVSKHLQPLVFHVFFALKFIFHI